MRKIFFFSISLLVLAGCKGSIENNNFIIYRIKDGIKNDKQLDLSSIADDIYYVPLETTKESIIAEIREIVFKDSIILVKDDLENLILFKEDGKFIKRIGKKGNGPNEYLHASEIIFSDSGDEIILYDGAKSQIIVYNIDSGEAIKVTKINFYPSAFELFNDTLIAFYCSPQSFPFSKNYHHIFLMNSNLEIVDSLYHRTNFGELDLVTMFTGFIKMYERNNKLYCWDSNSDTIVFLDEKRNIEKGFMFSYDKYKMPLSIRSSMDFWKIKEDYFYIDNFIETENYFFINGIYKNTFMKYIFYDKRKGISQNIVFNYDIRDWGFHNDLDGSIPFWPKGIAGADLMFDYIDPFTLKKLMNNEYFEKIPVKDQNKYEEITALLNRSQLTDNPIIFIIKLKK